MNKIQFDILNTLLEYNYTNQRIISEQTGHSLGTVNKTLNELVSLGYIDDTMVPSLRTKNELSDIQPQNAIILAAGYGTRMVPINQDVPKGLLEIKGVPLIEHIIQHLHAVNIHNIYIVVGYMKEQYEYLIDDYNVSLIVNREYSTKNNLHSLKLAQNYIGNSYIIPCDIWCKKNPFHKHEAYSWYMVTAENDYDSSVKINRKKDLVTVSKDKPGNTMIGISYITKEDSEILKTNLSTLCNSPYHDNDFWENALFLNNSINVNAKIVNPKDAVEINTYEQLRDIDSNSNQLESTSISIIAETLSVNPSEITDIEILKKGMTNRSFLFKVHNKKYIMRIPGEGTAQLINRTEEANVYNRIQGERICDNIIYINPSNGYKITEFLENAHVCAPDKEDDLKKCMQFLRNFHQKALKVDHTFDLFKQIDFYESLWGNYKSAFKHYSMTKEHVLSLKPFIEKYSSEKVLTHIDAVPDNFLFTKNAAGETEIRLIDWEYAGMQDPHVDIAMFCIYAMYDKEQIDHLIDLYFENNCSHIIRTKIYCYIATCGLLWSNWCEYKRQLGIDFGEYSLRQYRYAKDYYKYAMTEIEKMEQENNELC